MEQGLKNLYSGNFNIMFQRNQEDGSVVITLTKIGENKAYRFRVKDLYGEREEILEHEIVKHTAPKHIVDRMKEAKEFT